MILKNSNKCKEILLSNGVPVSSNSIIFCISFSTPVSINNLFFSFFKKENGMLNM